MTDEIKYNQYNEMLRHIITEIKTTRVVLAQRINSGMMQMYWNIGKRLSEEKMEKGYGANVVKRLSQDLKQEFPDTTGFSPRNLWDMKKFYEFYYLANEKLRQDVAVLPWKHNLLIMSSSDSLKEAQYYVELTHENSLSRNVLLNFIKADSYRNSKVLPKHNNFALTLPEDFQDQANEILKSNYNIKMLDMKLPFKERDLEKRIVEKIKYFLLELGTGFTFIGNQYRLTHNDKDYYVDLLFFNRKIHSLVAID